MTKQEIIAALEREYKGFIAEVEILNEQEFKKAPVGKWTAGQHLEHLRKSVFPLALGLKLPKFIPRLLFGKANRPPKTFEGLVEKYLNKIAAGAKASGPYIPREVPYHQQSRQVKKLRRQLHRLVKAVNTFSEDQLDKLVLPHPLLGKVVLREMLYFTIYHAEHHRKLVLRGLEA